MEYITIGNVKIKKTAALAPMASVADKSYRELAKEYGAAFVVGEMASCKGLYYSDRKTAVLLSCTEKERPMAVQLFGSEPEFFTYACRYAEQYAPNIFDINMGCPVNKVISQGSGCALMKNPALVREIVKAAVMATKIPVTVKIRKGYDDNNINAVEIAKIAEESGASAVTVHGRTRAQMYSGSADLDVIAAVKSAVSIPVIGNGDVTSVQSCIDMYNVTGCDLVMIGRGSYGKPWLFSQIEHYLESGEILPDPPLAERLSIMKKHIVMIVEDKGEYIGMKEARKHAAWYLKGLHNAAKYRNMSCSLTTAADVDVLIESVLNENKNH